MCIPENTLGASLKRLPHTFQKVIQNKNQEMEPFLELGSLGKKNSIVGSPKFTSSALRFNTILGSEILDSGHHLNISNF
jgi:hypothetical protein